MGGTPNEGNTLKKKFYSVIKKGKEKITHHTFVGVAFYT
ncbi:hypothetical protein RV14_GL001590 [Enterococcus ratti]|uniref:Uncharacterized protein n=1 Tax=Enterococcus ratti TaxID=150033 RepID=A0A1L8W8K1_9ENTE|nr:hypothetical protein RV14_GL001590 [Enterococcus ratti]